MLASRLARSYRVRFDEAGADGLLRSSGFLRYAQDLAWVHSESAGFGREWYAARGLTWLVRSIELDIVGAVEYGAEVDASTEVVGFRRVWARRRSEFRAPALGSSVAVALTDWVLLDRRGRPVRPPPEILAAFPTPPAGYAPLRLPALADGAEPEATPLSVRLADVDPMGHVNNAAYLDYFEEHLAALGRSDECRRRPRRYRAEFVGAAQAGMALIGEGWASGGGYDFRLRSAGDGSDLFRARLETDPALWAGG